LAPSYPWYTPYQFAGNKPIWAVDLDGLEEDIRNVINTRVTPIVDNLKLIPLYSPVSIQRNSGVNGGEYQYLVLFPKEGEVPLGFTDVQKWAYNKAAKANGSSLANRFFKHFLLGGGSDYLLTDSEISSSRVYPFSLKGTKFPNTGGASKNDVSFDDMTKERSERATGHLAEALNSLKIGESNPGFNSSISAGVDSKGTLGEFTINFNGTLTRTGDDSYSFEGTYSFYDRYDFNPRWFALDGLRSKSGESKVKQVKLFQNVTGNGEDFDVNSKEHPYKEKGKF
jgi:hypothetical protein